MSSGLKAASRALLVAPLVLVLAGAASWYVSRRSHRVQHAPVPAARTTPTVPRRLDPPRRQTEFGPDPGTYGGAFERGVAAYNADDVDAAADAFEEAVRLAPSEPEAHINLGLVYMRLQRPEDGLRELAAGASLEREHASPDTTRDGMPKADVPDDRIRTHDDLGRHGRR